IGISIIVFLISRLSPGDPVRLYTFGSTTITEEDIAALRAYYGLDKPLPLQYVDWFSNVLKGDFGMSLRYNRPALGLLLERLPATLQLALTALGLQLLIGVPFGVIAALRRGGFVDNAIRVFGVIGHAIPVFWIGLLMLVVEQVFTWPGVGQFTYAAARAKDYPVIMAGVMLASTLLVISYLVRDIVYAWVDPRIKVN